MNRIEDLIHAVRDGKLAQSAIKAADEMHMIAKVGYMLKDADPEVYRDFIDTLHEGTETFPQKEGFPARPTKEQLRTRIACIAQMADPLCYNFADRKLMGVNFIGFDDTGLMEIPIGDSIREDFWRLAQQEFPDVYAAQTGGVQAELDKHAKA